MTLTIITHYAENDPEFTSDYHSIGIYIDGELVREYGDSYHDKGKEKVEGYLNALDDLTMLDAIEHKSVADYEVDW